MQMIQAAGFVNELTRLTMAVSSEFEGIPQTQWSASQGLFESKRFSVNNYNKKSG